MKKNRIIFNLSLLAICAISLSLTFLGQKKLNELSTKKNILNSRIEVLKKENSSLNEKNSELNASKNNIEEKINSLNFN